MDAAQEHYKRSFDKAIDALGDTGAFPRAVGPKPDAVKHLVESADGQTHHHYKYPDDYMCTIAEGENMDGCCQGNDNDMTWLEAKDEGCHRIDIIIEQHCELEDGTAVRPGTADATCEDEAPSSELYTMADIDTICYMCLCDCKNQTADEPGYNASVPTCPPITSGDKYCHEPSDGAKHSFHSYVSGLKQWKKVGTFLVVSINQIIKKSILKSQPLMGLHDISDDNAGKAIRVFMLTLCMTGLLVVILRADIPGMSAIPRYSTLHRSVHPSLRRCSMARWLALSLNR